MWLSHPVIGNVPLSITPDTVWPELALQTTNGSICCCLIAPALSLALILLSSVLLHLLYILMSCVYHLMQREMQKVFRFTPKQVPDSSRNCPLLRFALYFPGGLERLRGSVWGLYFCPLFTLSSSLPSKLPLLQTLSHHSAPLARKETGARLKKYNNEELTGSDSRKADAVRGLGRWYYEQAILCL